MKINYVLIYGTPFLKIKYFEKFDDISKFLLNHRIVDYTIYEKMDGAKEVEMICLQSDVRVLEKRIDKAIQFVEKWKQEDGDGSVFFDINTNPNDLLNILKGDDK